MDNSFNRTNFQAVVLSGLYFGIGLAGGVVLAIFLVNNGAIRFLTGIIEKWQLFLRLLLAIFLFILFAGISGGVGGGIGAWGLSRLIPIDNQRRVIWRSAISFFITHALLIIPFILITLVVGFLNPDADVRFSRIPTLFLVYGLIYGAVAGLLLGWLLVGIRQTLRIFLAAIAGFAIGGWLAGVVLFLFAQTGSTGRLTATLAIICTVFVFGGSGGAALGLAMQYVQEGRAILPQTRNWRIVRNIVLVLVALAFLSALVKLVNTLTIKPGMLAERLELTTTGSQWQEETAEQAAAFNTGVMPSLDGEDGGSQVHCVDGQLEGVPDLDKQNFQDSWACQGDPVSAEDSAGIQHVLWYSDQTVNITGTPVSGHFLLESIGQEDGWSAPAIIAQPGQFVQPALSTLADGRLLLTWDEAGGEQFLTYTVYTCDDVPLSGLNQVVYNAARQEKFRPLDDPIPYCKNQFEQLMITPNPTAPENEEPHSAHGAFDRVADVVRGAKYEVLFTTMQWDKPSDTVSPGDTLAQAVYDLYEKVKAHPEDYPRGMTVRLMLGNMPDLAIFEPTNQITHVMQDLHDAGLREMVNEEIGWRLELADYAGAWPHAHSKFVVVDGETAISAGFNYSYLHLDKKDPSGLGLSMNDLGLQITGPVAQSVMSAYDDLWSDSDHYSCSRFPPPLPLLWFLWCSETPAVADHTPEVLRYYVTDGDTNAFSLHHTMKHLEADEAILSAIGAAQDRVDVYQVNFSLDTVCVVATLITGTCPFGELIPPYMKALANAVIERDVNIRVIMEETAMNGLENRMAIRWLSNYLQEHGKTKNVNMKFYNGKMHDKGTLIDEKLLVVGSQNFHWSAWDSPSLTEYVMATDDQEAISNFLLEYNYQWDKAIPVEEKMNGAGS